MSQSRLARLTRRLPEWLAFHVMWGLLLLRQRWLFDAIHARSVRASELADDERAWQRSLRRFGYLLIPGYKSAEWCDSARAELQAALDNPQKTSLHAEDVRVFGIDHLSSYASQFGNDPKLLRAASEYARSQEALAFCMANRVTHRDGIALGSGGEWHRDGYRRQMKAMLYLTDVDPADGPFSVIERSHRAGQILRDSLVLGAAIKRRLVSGLMATRLKDAGARLEQQIPGRRKVFAAPAGTLILFDTSTIHAGSPPEPGGKERLALTNYYVDAKSLPETLDYYRGAVTLN